MEVSLSIKEKISAIELDKLVKTLTDEECYALWGFLTGTQIMKKAEYHAVRDILQKENKKNLETSISDP